MLKKKVLRMFAALLGAAMLLTAAGTGAVFADGETLDGKVITYTFTETGKSMSWFEYKDLAASTEGLDYGWYAIGDTGHSEMIFCFDGSKTVTSGGVTYDMNGTPTQVRYLRTTWGGTAGVTDFYVSADKNTWVSLRQTFNAGDESYTGEVKYNYITEERYPAFYKGGKPNTEGYASYQEAVITVPEKFTDDSGTLYDTKYVKVTVTDKNKGGHYAICQPTVTYEALRRGFDVENSTAVYPSATDLKLDFDMALSANATDPASYTVADSRGNTVKVAEVSLNDANVASLTLVNALKPYTEYTVNVSDDVKTAQGNELTVKSAKFSTLAKDFSQSGRYYIDRNEDNREWFGYSNVNGKNANGYYSTGWGPAIRFLFDGSKKYKNNDTEDAILGIPTKAKLIFYYWPAKADLSKWVVSFKKDENTTLRTDKLKEYFTNDWTGIDGSTIPNVANAINSGITAQAISIGENDIPRETRIIVLWFNGYNETGYISSPQIAWNSTDIDGGSIATVNGEVPASNTLSVKYDAKIDAASVNAGDMVVFENGSAPITVSAASVSGDTAVLTLVSALKPYTKYMLQMPALKSVEGWNITALTKDFTTGSEYRTVTFTDTNPSNTWLQLWSASATSANDATWAGWYSAQGDNAKITIPFDGNHFKKQDGKRYKIDGVVDSIKCVIAGHGGYDASNVEIFVSENGEDWTSIGKADKYKSSGETVTGVGGFLSQQWIMLDKSALGASTKYVRFNLGENNGILKPTVTYTAQVEKYEINDVAYTANEDGTTTAAGKVYFNFDGDKETAAFTVITAAYDNGVLSDVKADTFTDVAKGSTADFSQTVKAGDATSIRTYVFESAASLKPIADMYR